MTNKKKEGDKKERKKKTEKRGSGARALLRGRVKILGALAREWHGKTGQNNDFKQRKTGGKQSNRSFGCDNTRISTSEISFDTITKYYKQTRAHIYRHAHTRTHIHA